jgi:hypothetical protein
MTRLSFFHTISPVGLHPILRREIEVVTTELTTTAIETAPTTALSAQETQYLAMLEATIKNGLGIFWKVGEALAEIRDRRLYRQEYSTFAEYCEKKWNFSSRRAYQLIESAEVAKDVEKALPSGNGKSGSMLPLSDERQNVNHGSHLNERQTRALASAPRARRGPILKAAVKTAPNGKLTAAHIRSVAQTAKETKAKTVGAIVKAHLAKPAPKPVSSNEALQRHEQRIAEDLKAIQSQKLYRKVAESFEDYLDGLVERVKGEM